MTDPELRALYQEVILDHSRHPRNFGVIEGAEQKALGHNPICGDQLLVTLLCNSEGTVEDVKFQGKGCAISMASASMMSELVKGKSQEKALALFSAFHKLTTSDEPPEVPQDLEEEWESLEALSGVRAFPLRVKCATLAWHTFEAALNNKAQVTTE